MGLPGTAGNSKPTIIGPPVGPAGTPGTENQPGPGLSFKFKFQVQVDWPAADSESARRVGATVTAPDGPEASAGESLPGRGRVNGGGTEPGPSVPGKVGPARQALTFQEW
jgi:hypothetical protein